MYEYLINNDLSKYNYNWIKFIVDIKSDSCNVNKIKFYLLIYKLINKIKKHIII